MSDDDLIRRGDALAAIQLGDTVTKLQARIRAIPCVDADPVCTGCGGTGVTYQTERRCACQGPDLTDPVTVHVNMLRGTIAKPTVEQIVHLYGREAFQPMIDVAIAKALEKACLAVSEHADWPEDEHGRTEQVGLFARVINAIRAITPALSSAPTDAAHVNETPKSEHDAGNVLTDAALIARLREIQGQAGLFASAAADRIEALVRVGREDALDLIAAHGQAQEAYEAQLKAEARAERLEAAMRKLHHAVCGETGFAACVRLDSGKAYPWPALDDADEAARAALTETATTEDRT